MKQTAVEWLQDQYDNSLEKELTLDERAKLHQNPNIFYDIHGSFNIGDSIENSDMTIEDRKWLHSKFDEAGIPRNKIK
jgi:hypothetical protein